MSLSNWYKEDKVRKPANAVKGVSGFVKKYTPEQEALAVSMALEGCDKMSILQTCEIGEGKFYKILNKNLHAKTVYRKTLKIKRGFTV